MNTGCLVKIVIVDDEFIVRMGFKSILDWEKHGYTVAGEAKNAQEALQLLQSVHPDVMICDIKLGATDGIDLLRGIKEHDANTRVIMLTHYDSFELARNALRYGADEYLLKSDLTPDLILNTLDRIFKSRKQPAHTTQGQADRNELRAILESALFKRKPEEALLSDASKNYLFLLIRLYPGEDMDEDRIAGLRQPALAMIDEIFRNHTIRYVTELVNWQFFLLLASSEEASAFQTAAAASAELLHKSLESVLGVENLVGHSQSFSSAGEAARAFQHAKLAVKQAYFTPKKVAAFHHPADSGAAVQLPDMNTLLKYIQQQDEDGLIKYVSGCFASCQKRENLEDMRQVFNDFLSFLKPLSSFRAIELSHPVLEAKLSYQIFERMCGYEAASRYIADLYCDCFMQQGHTAGYSRNIRKCLAFINENYQKNLSLKEIADYVDVNMSYLSTLFKQEMNVNISSYINEYRIGKAKELIRDSNLHMYEIAMQVGFDNPYYFSKVFKESVGMTCMEYRNKFGR